MGNKLGIEPNKEINSKKFKEMFDKLAKKDRIDNESALKFLKALSEEANIEYDNFKGSQILRKIDPYGIGLDLHRFMVFFFQSTEEAREKGSLLLSESMISSGLEKKFNLKFRLISKNRD